MSKLKAIIVDDEIDSIDLLVLQLQRHCPIIEKITTYNDSIKALAEIAADPPDILFLDIEMPQMNGLELIKKLQPLNFHVIFVTAYNEYAIKAFRLNALDYLVKPVDVEELKSAVERASINPEPSYNQYDLVQKIMNGEIPKKIAVSNQNGVMFLELENIIYITASRNYAVLSLFNDQSVTVPKTLKDIQDVLEQTHFFRIHRHYLININHIKYYNRVDCTITMIDNTTLPLARSQKDKLLEKYGWI